VTRVPADARIFAPPFPPELQWLNAGDGAARQTKPGPMLVEFWDFCRPYSLRTLPYVQAWHERYHADGLLVVGVHTPGFLTSSSPDAVQGAVARLGISHAVAVDTAHEIWRLYENEGWPARYLFSERGALHDYHYGEGAYAETELAILDLLGRDGDPLPPLRPEDEPGAQLVVPSHDVAGAYSGPYAAGAAWGIFDGGGTIAIAGEELTIDHPGARLLVEHPHHTTGVLDLRVGPGVTCEAVCFTAGLVPPSGAG
jgi:hypothetical protein